MPEVPGRTIYGARMTSCLVCGRRPATHRFAVLGGPAGWLCESCKDDPVTINGKTYGEQQRRSKVERPSSVPAPAGSQE